MYRYLAALPGVDVLIPIFGDFRPFSAIKLAFFLKTHVTMEFLQTLAVFWIRNADFCPIFLRIYFKNILKIGPSFWHKAILTPVDTMLIF
jgi:hypothetical protein